MTQLGAITLASVSIANPNPTDGISSNGISK